MPDQAKVPLANPDGELLAYGRDVSVAVVAGDHQVGDLVRAQSRVRGDEHVQHTLISAARLQKREIPVLHGLVVHPHYVLLLPVIHTFPCALALGLQVRGLTVPVGDA